MGFADRIANMVWRDAILQIGLQTGVAGFELEEGTCLHEENAPHYCFARQSWYDVVCMGLVVRSVRHVNKVSCTATGV